MLKFAILCSVLAVSAGLAPQLAVKPDVESHVPARIQGTWKIEAALSSRLDSTRAAATPKDLTFSDNPGVLAGLQAYSDRFKNNLIIGSGIVNVDGTTHTYILIAEHGGTTLEWFTGNAAGTDPLAQVSTYRIAIAIAHEAANDVLFLGGDLKGSAALAYTHPAATKR
jgi:hypothetical protein